MKNSLLLPSRNPLRIRELLAIFLVIFLGYALCATGYVDTAPGKVSLNVARSLYHHQKLSVEPSQGNWEFFYKHPDKKLWYTKMGLTYPLLYVPILWIADLNRTKLPKELVAEALISLVNSFLVTLMLCGLFAFFRLEGLSFRQAAGFTLAAAFGTYLFAYSKTTHRDILESLSVFGALLFAYLATKYNKSLFYFVCGLLATLGLLTKNVVLVPLLPVLFFAFWNALRSSRTKQNLALFLAPLVTGALIWAAYSYNGFGSVFATGYSKPVTNPIKGSFWSGSLVKGLHTQLTSLNSGFFLYNPPLTLIALILLWKALRWQLKPLAVVALLSISLQACLYARWFNPLGGWGLGPRYLLMAVPLLFLCAGRHLELLSHPRWLRNTWLALVLFSVGFQLIHVSVKHTQYWTLSLEAKKILPIAHWKANSQFFLHKLTTKDEKYSLADFGSTRQKKTINLAKYETLVGFNYWWAHYRRWQENKRPHLSTQLKKQKR